MLFKALLRKRKKFFSQIFNTKVSGKKAPQTVLNELMKKNSVEAINVKTQYLEEKKFAYLEHER